MEGFIIERHRSRLVLMFLYFLPLENNLMFDILFVFKRCLTGKVRSRNLSAQKPNQLNWKNLDAANITLFFI